MDAASAKAGRRSAGQFYTPPEVARFMLELLITLAPQARSELRSVIDPACGQGVFLEAALGVLEGDTERLLGVDLHRPEGEFWSEDAEHGAELLIGDGLLVPSEGPFDLVVGNPPYHGEGLRCLEVLTGHKQVSRDERAHQLAIALAGQYSIWKRAIAWDEPPSSSQLAIPGTAEPVDPDVIPMNNKQLKQLAKFPVEIMFLDRFVQLCRPGGYVVVVMPEGVVANRRLQYVRDWCNERCRVLGVVSLPRGTFRKSGTSAVTATLILQRREADGAVGAEDRTVLVEVERLDRLDGLLDRLRDGRDAGEGARGD